jgi:hypothetical protein
MRINIYAEAAIGRNPELAIGRRGQFLTYLLKKIRLRINQQGYMKVIDMVAHQQLFHPSTAHRLASR